MRPGCCLSREYSALNIRKLKDASAHKIMLVFSGFVLSLAFLMAAGLFLRAQPILALKPLNELLFSSTWNPGRGAFGLANFIISTVWVTSIAIIIAVPLSVLTAIYLSEYAHRKFRDFARPVIDLLAGISPVVYGVWGMLAIVPLVRDYLMPFFSEHFPFFPFVSENYTGFSTITAGIVLAVMTFPIIISITEEVISRVPFELREASLALGATKWETIKYTVLKKAKAGIIAAIILGLSRSFGETMAVLMVAGCTIQGFPKSVFDPAYPLPALIANTYGEMMSIPLYDAAVLLAAFILLIVTMLCNVVGWGILFRIEKKGM
jgi:phosphate transport system permease protein